MPAQNNSGITLWLEPSRNLPGREARGEEALVKWAYLGLFAVTLATLMYEILITRIFSVALYYHYAFMAISLAMFGMTAGALWVYLSRSSFIPPQAGRDMAVSSLIFGICSLACTSIFLTIPVASPFSMKGFALTTLAFVVMAIPFVFSGICVCLALTRFPGQISKLYAADLAGGAAGCILVIYALRLTDGPTAVVIVALVACLGSVAFATGGRMKNFRRNALFLSAGLGIFVVVNSILASRQESLLNLAWVKYKWEARPIYEKWNSFSRIAIDDPGAGGDLLAEEKVATSGGVPDVRELRLTIDGAAETTLTAFHGDLRPLEYLKHDIRNVAHYIRPNAKVLVIGAGGGRDILSALAFGQQSVRAVEMNQDILAAVNRRFGDFTGHLDRNPKVTFVNDEARSYVARLKERFDIIQISFIDTWAATAAGGFTLAENSLYTLEAWDLFLSRLTPDGVLSVSRWYFRNLPGEAYRLTSLAAAALRNQGVANPRQNIVLVCDLGLESGGKGNFGAGTILVSRKAFSAKDLNKLEEVAQNFGLNVVLSPNFATDSTFSRLASGKDLDQFTANLPINLAPPTDDRPFFFNLLRLRDAFHPLRWNQGTESFNLRAVVALGYLLIVVIALSLLAIVVPLVLTTRKQTLRGATPHFVFFAALGFGFMFIEVSLMQRLIIFLGHPTYGLSVVLFALLISSGMGSYASERLGNLESHGLEIADLLLLVLVVALTGIATPHIINSFQTSNTPWRIILATGIILPMGLMMGTAFPMGLKLASRRSKDLTPWLWGINGASSVCASVLGVAIALSAGISRSFWAGLGCYAVALFAFAWAARAVPREAASAPNILTSCKPNSLQDTTQIAVSSLRNS